MAKIKGWNKTKEGIYDHKNKISYITIDPDMNDDGSIYWVVHIKNKHYESYINKFDTKEDRKSVV